MYPRSEWDEKLLSALADKLVLTWLQLMWLLLVLLKEDRFEKTVNRRFDGKRGEMGDIDEVVFPMDPNCFGPVSAAGFLCSGFAHAPS